MASVAGRAGNRSAVSRSKEKRERRKKRTSVRFELHWTDNKRLGPQHANRCVDYVSESYRRVPIRHWPGFIFRAEILPTLKRRLLWVNSFAH